MILDDGGDGGWVGSRVWPQTLTSGEWNIILIPTVNQPSMILKNVLPYQSMMHFFTLLPRVGML